MLEIAQSASGVAVVDRSAATVRSIDASALRLGPPRPLGVIAQPTAIVGVGQPGVVAADPATSRAALLPPAGDTVPFDLGGPTDAVARIAPDGAVWAIGNGALQRITTTGRQTFVAGLSTAQFTLIGNRVLLFDSGRSRLRFGDGEWVDVPAGVSVSEVVLQVPGPAAECGWFGSDDTLWCVGRTGIVEEVRIDGLGIDGADVLAIAGDAAALVRRNPSELVRIDWRDGRILDDVVASIPIGGNLAVAASVDLIWVDQTDGDLVWAVNPWGVNVIRKNDSSTPLLSESGELLDAGSGGDAPTASGNNEAIGAIDREPDDDGIDDPPVAVDDPVTARTGAPVPVAVTNNDYDPDGEAIVLFGVGDAAHGSVEIASASTVVYQPDAGFIGFDRFEYTIVDGDGTRASAVVTLELLPSDATNQAPVGAPDTSQTGPDAAVVVDVLLNDIDPERDALRIDSFTAPNVGGSVSETIAASGLPGLRFVPPRGASGVATFTYRPVDSFGAVGESVSVTIEIAQPTDENRPPIVRPDALRVRRDIPAVLPVLANDSDPDGDPLTLRLVEPLPPGIAVRLLGNELEIIARAGAELLSPLSYRVDDGHGHEVIGSVLVAVIAEIEPNRPPIANADSAVAVVATTQLIDVLANDSDPDGDPLILLGVRPTEGASPGGSATVQGDQVQYRAATSVDDEDGSLERFSYVISDGNGHEVRGELTIRVLPEPIAAPPFAQDDAATTEIDLPVTLDVLRNDGDPSGERPTLVGTPGCAGGGTAVVTPDARVTYRPPPGMAGVFSCTYEVTNSQGLRAGAAIVVSVLEPEIVNLAPIVTDEEVTVVIGETLVIDLLANDRDPDGEAADLRVLSSTRPALGRASRDGGVITFEAGTATGAVAITYQVGDDNGGVSAGRLVIRIVEPDPEPPVAADDQRTIIGPGVATTIDVLANDSDPDGERSELRIAATELIQGDGDIEVAGTSITFLPQPDFVGDLVVVYTVQDPDQLTATGRAVLTVLEAPNRSPIADDDAAEVINGGVVTVAIALNDSDPDGDPLTYSIVAPPDPSLGVGVLDAGMLRFEAVPGASGVATIVYRVDDGEDIAEATVRVSVLPCAVAPPEAPDVFLQTGYQQPIAIDLTSVARNGEIVDVGAPLSAAAGVYTPPAGENGNVVFNYVVRNSCRIQDIGEVVIDVNQDPLGAPYTNSIGRIDPVTIPVSALASDAEPLTIVGLEGAPPWVSLVDRQRAIRIEPGGNVGGLEMVAVISDPGGLRVRVPIVVTLVNLAPIANDDLVAANDGSVTFDLLANDTDPDGDPISLGSVPKSLEFTNGAVGTIQTTGNNGLRIDPKDGVGSATFTYTIVDGPGQVSAPATVTVTVNGRPSAPTVGIVVPAGESVRVNIPATDPDGDALTLAIVDDPAPLSIEVDGLLLTVAAPTGSVGAEATIAYTVTDTFGASTRGELVINVDPPIPTTTTTSTSTTSTSTSTTSTTSTTTTSTTTSTTTTTAPTTTSTTTSSTSTTHVEHIDDFDDYIDDRALTGAARRRGGQPSAGRTFRG